MSIEHHLRAVADALNSSIPAISEEIRQRSRAGAPNYYRRSDPMFQETELPSITGALTSIIHGMRHARHLPDGASEGALEEARLAAQTGVELSDLLLTRRIGQVVLWNWILDTTVSITSFDWRMSMIHPLVNVNHCRHLQLENMEASQASKWNQSWTTAYSERA